MRGKTITKWTRRERIDTLIDIETLIKEKRALELDSDTIIDELMEYAISERRKICQEIENERLHPKEVKE